MPQEVEIKLVANSSQYVASVQNAQKENQKLYDQNAKNQKREKGLIKELEDQLDRLKQKKRDAYTLKELEQYNLKIQVATDRLKEYNEAGLSAYKANEKMEKTSQTLIQSFGKWVLSIGLVTTAIGALKKAFLETEQGLRAFNQIAAATKQVLTDIVNGIGVSIPKMREAMQIAKELDDLRLKDMVSNFKAQAYMRRYNELYVEGLDQQKTGIERLEKLTKAREVYQAGIDEEIGSTKAMLVLVDRKLAQNITDTKAMAEKIKLEGKLQDLEGQRVGGLKRIESMLSGLKKAESDRLDDYKEKLQKWYDELDEMMRLQNMKVRDKFGPLGILDPYAIDEYSIKYLEELGDKVVKLQADIEKRASDIVLKSADKGKKINAAVIADNEKLAKYEAEQKEERLAALREGLTEIQGIVSQMINEQARLAQRQREIFDQRISEAQSALQAEIQLSEAGFAANIGAKQREIEQLQKLREKALKDEEEAIKRQQQMERISQAVNIFSASTNILKEYTKLGPIGLPLAAGAIALMFTLLTSVRKRTTDLKLAEGGHGEVKGRTHSQGGEPFLSHVEIEQGERWGVLSRSANRKYGRVFDRMVDSFNKHEINPEAVGVGVQNVLVENTGPNRRLDEVNKNLRSIRERESIMNVGDRVIIKKGCTTQVIKKR